jgi:hypothetical protein
MRSLTYILILASIALSSGGVGVHPVAQSMEGLEAAAVADGLGSCQADGHAAAQREPTAKPASEAPVQRVATAAKERDPRKFRTLNGRGYNYSVPGRPETQSP